MNLIDEKKLAELRKMWRSDPEYNLEDGNMTRVFDTLSLALKVVRAAQRVECNGYLKECNCLHGSGCGVCNFREALVPFSTPPADEKKGKIG